MLFNKLSFCCYYNQTKQMKRKRTADDDLFLTMSYESLDTKQKIDACAQCGHSRNDIFICHSCNLQCCYKCAHKCIACDVVCCENCYHGKCHKCSAVSCSNCDALDSCDYCRNKACKDCERKQICFKCDTFFVDICNHMFCSGCDGVFCARCAHQFDRCKTCKNTFCTLCSAINKRCNRCSFMLCKSCKCFDCIEIQACIAQGETDTKIYLHDSLSTRLFVDVCFFHAEGS